MNDFDKQEVKSGTLKRTKEDISKLPSSTISLSTARSSSGCYSFTSQTSSIISSLINNGYDSNPTVDNCSEICLRKQPTRCCVTRTSAEGTTEQAFQPTTNSIRCICSCISDQCGVTGGSMLVTCDCDQDEAASEEANDTTPSLTPKPARRADTLLAAESKLTGRRSLNPLAYFRTKVAFPLVDDRYVEGSIHSAPLTAPRIRKSLWQRARDSILPLYK